MIVAGLAVDQAFAWGQRATDVAVWLLFAVLLVRAPCASRGVLAACVLIAAAGECVLSLAWGIYDCRLGNVPLFVPAGHALLLAIGRVRAHAMPRRWCLRPCTDHPEDTPTASVSTAARADP